MSIFTARRSLLIWSILASVNAFPVAPAMPSRSTRLYAANDDNDNNNNNNNNDNNNNKLGLLTFDLDDTLFHCGDSVQAANSAMLQAISANGGVDTTVTEFLATTKAIRKTLTSKITYKELRTRAIQATLEQGQSSSSSSSSSSVNDIQTVADECYQVWLSERHAAAERNLLEGAVEMLQEIKLQHPEACIVAITNGAGDPLEMPNTLAKYFDFRISGEEVEVFPYRKPDSFIYEYTLQQYEAYNEKKNNANRGAWCHVGDCLVNDVQASAKCGATAIWLDTKSDDEEDDGKQPFYSTATPEEQQERAEKAKNARDSAAAEINSLSELPKAISALLLEKEVDIKMAPTA